MHPALLFSVIERQAGTLSKALLEGVMNSVDAGASKITVTIKSQTTTIEDDGRGFTDRTEIERFFETFGEPHSDSENKRYGAFRMGRGQMFAFGRNRWRSGAFSMAVDIKGKGLDYDLVTESKAHTGCSIAISLYKALSPTELATTERDLARWVKYVPIPVYINGKLASKDPATENWTEITEEAYIRIRESGAMSVYNLGVFVADFGSYRFGVAGEVVSRKQLRVNFARNDVQSDCGVWRKVLKVLKQDADESTKKRKRRWTEDEKIYSATGLASGAVNYDSLADAPLITDVTGSDWTINRFFSVLHGRYAYKVTSAATGDRKGDVIMRQRLAFVISTMTLERFGVASTEELIECFERAGCSTWTCQSVAHVSFDVISQAVNDSHFIIDEAELTLAMKIVRDVLDNASRHILKRTWRDRVQSKRSVRFGRSESAAAWTDGATYVAINANELRDGLDVGLKFWVRMSHLMFHEYCHHEPSADSHVHGREFFETYHDMDQSAFIEGCMIEFPKMLEKHGRKARQRTLRAQDHKFRTEQAMTSVAACIEKEGHHA